MPFRSGALSVRRYVVQGELSASFERTATMAIRRYEYRPIDDERAERESFGWVNPRNLLAERFLWEDVVDGNLAFLAVRRDRKTFNKMLFQARRLDLYERTRKERGLERLTRQHRLALDEQLTVQMLKEVTPTIAFTEMAWDLHTGDVYIGATGQALCERIVELFHSTFDIRLAPQFPSIWGYDAMCAQGLEENYDAANAALAQG